MRGDFKEGEGEILSKEESRECEGRRDDDDDEDEARESGSKEPAVGARRVLSQLASTSSSSSSSLETDRGANFSGSCRWSGSVVCDGTVPKVC